LLKTAVVEGKALASI